MADRMTRPLSPLDSGLFALFGAVIALIVVFFAQGGIALGWYALPLVFGVAGYLGAAVRNRLTRS